MELRHGVTGGASWGLSGIRFHGSWDCKSCWVPRVVSKKDSSPGFENVCCHCISLRCILAGLSFTILAFRSLGLARASRQVTGGSSVPGAFLLSCLTLLQSHAELSEQHECGPRFRDENDHRGQNAKVTPALKKSTLISRLSDHDPDC